MGRGRKSSGDLDRELDDLPAPARWREWMGRVEAAIFAAAEPVLRENLARVVGKACNLELIIADIRDELRGSRDAIAALRGEGLIAAGPRSPTPGAPYAYVDAGVPLPLRVRILTRPAGHREARGRWTAGPAGEALPGGAALVAELRGMLGLSGDQDE